MTAAIERNCAAAVGTTISIERLRDVLALVCLEQDAKKRIKQAESKSHHPYMSAERAPIVGSVSDNKPNNNNNNKNTTMTSGVMVEAKVANATSKDLHFFDAHQSEQNHRPVNAAVIASAALVGENVVDNNSQGSSHHHGKRSEERAATPKNTKGPMKERSDNSVLSQESGSWDSCGSEAAVSTVGFVAQGLAWIREQQELRRRQYLQAQAEEQARKIRAAQLAEKDGSLQSQRSARGLMGNSTFRTLADSVWGVAAPGCGVPTMADSERSTGSTAVMHSLADQLDENNPFGADDKDMKAGISYSGDGYSVEIEISETDEEDESWIPAVRIADEDDENDAPFLMTQEQRQQIAKHVLPRGIAYAKWKRLYSLSRDGDSFEACLRHIKGQSQTLLVVRSDADEIFGGFADSAWDSHMSARVEYRGGATSCLYTFAHGDIRAFRWTGANRYVQLCDNQHRMLAFGGGGKEGAFGLAVAQDFQRGSTGHCATFDNEPLAKAENFAVLDVEIYGFMLGQF